MKNIKKIENFLKNNKIIYTINEPLNKHTSIKIGGQANVFVWVKTQKQFVNLLNFLSYIEQKYYILGNGTNTLVSDKGYSGVVICTKYLKKYRVQKIFFLKQKQCKNKRCKTNKNKIEDNNKKCSIYVQAGMGLFEFGRILKQLEFSGFEFAYGIPGTIGGAICMNAGAFNHSVGDFVEYVKVFDNGKIKKIKKDNMRFDYRTSIVQNSNLIVLGVKFVFKKSTTKNIEILQNQFLQQRLQNQPYKELSFGSVFKKNLKYEPISKLIDNLGLKGYTVGGAQISKKHAGFIVNIASATCQDCLLLIKYIQQKIFEAYGFVPEPEVKLLED